jgi:hypothetical protein
VLDDLAAPTEISRTSVARLLKTLAEHDCLADPDLAGGVTVPLPCELTLGPEMSNFWQLLSLAT